MGSIVRQKMAILQNYVSSRAVGAVECSMIYNEVEIFPENLIEDQEDTS